MSIPSDQPDRRGAERFSIELTVFYRLIPSRKGDEVYGYGRTVNISSSGVLFTTEQLLPPRCSPDLYIDWPVKLDDKHALTFLARGSIVRSGPSFAALEIRRYEFRTKGNGLPKLRGFEK
jgi:hypothetical protein